MDTDSRIYQCERDIKEIVDRLGKVEDKASGAWKTIGEINGRMDKIEAKVDGLEKDVKELKVGQERLHDTVRWVVKGLIVLGVIIMVTGLVALKNGSEVPQKVVEAVIPLLKGM